MSERGNYDSLRKKISSLLSNGKFKVNKMHFVALSYEIMHHISDGFERFDGDYFDNSHCYEAYLDEGLVALVKRYIESCRYAEQIITYHGYREQYSDDSLDDILKIVDEIEEYDKKNSESFP